MTALAKRPGDGPATGATAMKAVKKAGAAPVKKAAKKAPAKKAAAKKAPAKKAPAKKAAKKAPAKKAPAKKAPARKKAAASGSSTGRRGLPAAPTDPLEILGLSGPPTSASLKRAWREYAARHHPDQGGDPATFARGRGAFETLRAAMEAS